MDVRELLTAATPRPWKLDEDPTGEGQSAIVMSSSAVPCSRRRRRSDQRRLVSDADLQGGY